MAPYFSVAAYSLRKTTAMKLHSHTTALVLIDLQQGIVGRELAPRSGSAVVNASTELAERFRQAGAPVVLVRVAWTNDFGDVLKQRARYPALQR